MGGVFRQFGDEYVLRCGCGGHLHDHEDLVEHVSERSGQLQHGATLTLTVTGHPG